MCMYKHPHLWSIATYTILFCRNSKSMIMCHNNTINNPIILKLLTFNNEFRTCLLYSTSTCITHTHIKPIFYSSRNIHKHQTANCKEMNNKHEAKPRKPRRIKADVQNYLKSVNPKFLEICPKESLSISNIGKSTLHLVDPNVAKKFVEMIADDILRNKSLVVEANPGMGILTVELLESGVPFLNIFESSKCFYPSLQKVQQEYPDRIKLHKIQLFNLPKIAARLNESLNLENYLDTTVQVIGCTAGHFLRTIPTGVLYPDSVLLNGRVTFYLAVSPIEWKMLTCKYNEKPYSKSSILFQSLCDYKELGTLDRQAFLPWQSYSAKTAGEQNISENDFKNLYVVKIQAKREYLKEYFKPEDLQVFARFAQKYLTARSRRMIPSLEKWIPGCGPRLIARGYNIFTSFGELEPNELIELFRDISTWPEYSTNAKYLINKLNVRENGDQLFLDKYNPGS